GTGATGTLSGSNLSGGTDGVYSLAAASPATISQELDALLFTPSAGAPDSSTTTTFTLSDASSAGSSASNNAITVTDNDAAVAPTITVPGAQTIEVNQSTSIGSVSLAESGATTGETFTVTLKDSNGLRSEERRVGKE